jgi:hypothetical protein
LLGDDFDCGSQSRIKGEVKRGVDLLPNQGVIEFLSRFNE